VDFSAFDRRGYRVTDVRSGYREWAATYEGTVQDAMDIALLDMLVTPPWASLGPALDLGCGTGRTGAWLQRHGVATIDGVDLTPEMLERASFRNVYRRLFEGDVTATGLGAAAYKLVTVCLVDEHLPDLAPLYAEAMRLTAPGGYLVLVGFHPHFIMASGMPTHYTNAAGEEVAIATHVHLLSEHVGAALAAGWILAEMRERVIDDDWLALKPKWDRFRGHPISVAFVWRKVAWPTGMSVVARSATTDDGSCEAPSACNLEVDHSECLAREHPSYSHPVRSRGISS
jgi:SAM-dependent methyltransferase